MSEQKSLADMTEEERAASASQAFQWLMGQADEITAGKQRLYIRDLREMAEAVERFPIGSQRNGQTVIGYKSPEFDGGDGLIRFDGGDEGVLVLSAYDVLHD